MIDIHAELNYASAASIDELRRAFSKWKNPRWKEALKLSRTKRRLAYASC